jgi:hypothetical protein
VPGRTSWFGAPMQRRFQILIYAVIIFVAVALAAVLTATLVFRSTFDLSDRLSAINDIFAGSALLLGLTAGLIALQAHAAATGRPNIRVQVWLGADRPNRLILVAEPTDYGRLRSMPVGGQTLMHIRLDNRGDYSADGLVVSVHFRGVAFDRAFDTRINGWRVVDAVEGRGATAAEWSDGSALHGRTSRRLPELDTNSLVQLGVGDDCAVEILVASNDYLRRVPPVPVRFVNAREAPHAGLAGDDLPEWI